MRDLLHARNRKEIWRDESLDKRYWKIDAEMEIRRLVGCKNKERCKE
jgi:hypothetical protein